MPPRAILFDLDDTLTDRSASIQNLLPKFVTHFQPHLRKCDPAEIHRHILVADKNGYAPRRDLAAHLQSTLPWQTAPPSDEIVTFWHTHFPPSNVERAGAAKTLQTLHQRGFKLAVVTNGQPTQRVKIRALAIESMLSAIIVSEELGIKKPDPRIFHTALDQLSVAPADALFIGDNPILDIAGPRAIGMPAIWLNCNSRTWPPDAGPVPQIITSIPDLLTLRALG